MNDVFQILLESSLKRRLSAYASPEYELTWKNWATESGLLILAQRASAHRTSASGSTGWPTPCTQDGPNGGPAQGKDRLPGAAATSGWPTPREADTVNTNETPAQWEERQRKAKAKNPNLGGLHKPLGIVAKMSGWPTPQSLSFDGSHQPGNNRQINKTMELVGWRSPMSGDGEGGVMQIRPGTAGKYKLRDEAQLAGWATPQRHDAITGKTPEQIEEMRKRTGAGVTNLCEQALLAGWATPAATTWGGSAEAHLERKRKAIAAGKKMGLVVSCLDQQVTLAPGLTPLSSTAPTGSRGVLDAAFSRWLMGFLVAWDLCSPGYQDWVIWQDWMRQA